MNVKLRQLAEILTVTLIVTQIFSIVTLSTPSQISITGYTKPNELLAPGETEVPITFTIINLGETLYNVNISPITTYPLEVYSYYNSSDVISIPVLESGSEINVTFIYNVVSTAKDGIYKVPLWVNSSEGNEKIYFTIPILGYVKISGQSAWGTQNSPLVVTAGENYLPLTIILINDGNIVANNVSISLINKYPVRFDENSTFVGYLPIGTPVPVTVYASIYSNATTGVYYIPIVVHYFYNISEEINIPVYINGYLNFSISTIWGTTSEPITASPGMTQLPLTFIVKNLGDVTVTNVSISLLNSYPVYTTQKNVYIGIVPAGEENLGTIIVNIYSNATPGVYYIPVVIHYFDTSSIEYVPIVISSPKLSINMITLPPQVFPGYYDVRVEAIITNYGSGIAEDANISLISPFPIISPKSISIGAIPVGKPINVTFLINVPNDTSAGAYQIKFIVKYDGGEVTKVENLTIYPKANIVIEKIIYSSLNPGSNQVPITFVIKNIGNATAKNVIVYLGPSNVIKPYVSTSNPLSALTASEASVGELKPGQEANVTYVVDVSSGIPASNYPVILILVWNQTGSFIPFEQTQTVTITVSPSAFSQFTAKIISDPIILLLSVIIIILLIIIAVVATRTKKK